MEEKLEATIRDDFHSINNLLHKITTHVGMAKYSLENNSINLEKIEDEKARLIKVMDGVEEDALKIGEILKKMRKSIHAGEIEK